MFGGEVWYLFWWNKDPWHASWFLEGALLMAEKR
jgi:hypothetical protein